MQSLISLVAQIRSTLIDNDYYFVDNVAMDVLGNHPRFQAKLANSTGCISYSNSDNTYWSPSVVALVQSRDRLASIIFQADNLVRDIEVKLRQKDIQINSFYTIYRNNAFGGGNPEPEFQLKNLVVTHYDDFETDGKQSSDHPYIMNAFDFFAIEGRNEESLPNAFLLKKIFAHFDILSFLFAGEKPMLQELVTVYEEKAKDYAFAQLLKLTLEMMEKEMKEFLNEVSAFHEKHAEIA